MKKLFAGIFFTVVAGFATTSFGGALTLSGFGGAALDDSAGAPVPSAIVSPLTYNGSTVGGPTFDRPVANGANAPTTLSGIGTAVSYDVVMFTVATAGTYSFLSTATSANYDNYTFLYQGAFNAASPLTGVLIGNDDLTSTTTSGFSKALVTGTMYSFVTTGYANTDAGTFTDTITMTSAVPEPGAWAMIGAGFVGLVVVQRLRRRTV